MSNAPRDDNFVPTLLAASSADGTTPVPVYADPTSHRLLVDIPRSSGSATSQTGTNANVLTAAVGAADASFWVGVSATCTAYTSGSMQLQLAYTDETNTSRTANINGHFTSGYGVNVSGTGAFEGQLLHIRAKAGTNIVISTIGTFTLTYDIYATINKVA
jgi:hypothetical protein